MYSELSKRQLFKRFFSNAGIYGVALILARIGGLLLLPLYWKKLSPVDFGIIGLTQMVTLFFAPILSLGLYDAVQRFFHEWEPQSRPHYLGALWLASVLLSIFLCTLAYCLGDRGFSIILSQVPFSPFIELAIGIAFLTNLNLFPLTLMRVREELDRFTFVTLGSFVTQSAAILFFLFKLNWKAEGYLLGMFLNACIWGLYFIVFMLKEVSFSFQKHHLLEPLNYALPTVPASIMEGIGNIFDRFFLDKYVALGGIGLYNIGNQLGGVLNSFNQILKASWVPLIIRVISDRKDGSEILGRFSVYYISAMTIPAIAITLLSKEMIDILADDRFSGVYPFIPWFVLIYYLQAIGTAMGRGLDLAKKTIFSPIIPLVGIVANLAGMWVLVPLHGVWGAVAAFLITTVLRIGTQIALACYFYPRPLLLKSLFKIFAIALVFVLLGSHINFSNIWITVLAKITWILLSVVLLALATPDWDKAKEFLRAKMNK